MKYTGEKCFNCGETFGASDDVVVCPDCGTPYHRACYEEAGHCINDLLHENGGSWKSEKKSGGDKKLNAENSIFFCMECDHPVTLEDEVCPGCGTSLKDPEEQDERAFSGSVSPLEMIDLNKQYFGFNPDEDFEGVKLKEMAEFVHSNTLYYLPMFKRMKDFGVKLSFNMICLFFPQFYFANRKMWLWAILSALAYAVLNIPEYAMYVGSYASQVPMLENTASFIISNEEFILALGQIFSLAEWIFRIGICLFGNRLYYKFVIRSVKKVKKFYGGPVSPGCLNSKGGVSPVNVLGIAAITLALSAALFFAVIFLCTFMGIN